MIEDSKTLEPTLEDIAGMADVGVGNMDYINAARGEIQKWEGEKPGFLQKVGSAVLAPAEKAAEKLVPKRVTEAVAKAIEACLAFLAKQGPRSFDAEAIRKSVRDRAAALSGGNPPDFAQRLQAADERSQHYRNWHVGYAATEGAGTGSLGLPGLAADIPALFGILVREIQEIGCCYGYDPSSPEEQEYLLHILRAGFASNVKLKMEFVVIMKEFEQILLRVAWKQMAKELASKQVTKGALLAGLRHLAKTLGVQITKRKALQMIPVIGAVVGASLNGTLANDIGKTAYMSYRRRYIQEHGGAALAIE
jgi:hypothetical protein